MNKELLKNVAIHHRGFEGECRGLCEELSPPLQSPPATYEYRYFQTFLLEQVSSFFLIKLADSESFQNTLIKLMLGRVKTTEITYKRCFAGVSHMDCHICSIIQYVLC